MHDQNAFIAEVQSVGRELLAYCRNHDWAGHDPYDALNSRLLGTIPFLDWRIPRIAMTQLLKRSPINLRGLLQIPRTQNPKAIALFISALLRAPSLAPKGADATVDSLVERLAALRSPGVPYWCWGYSFPWQTRSDIVPRWTPNLVCTCFAAGAFLDLYEARYEPEHLRMAISGAEYILNELYWCGESSVAGFGYPLRSVRNQVHNANLLGAALLVRVYRHTGESRFLTPALKVARYSAAQQRPDGSWPYGEAPSQQWVDNFHTGYVLCALHQIDEFMNSDEFGPAIARGFHFFRSNFLERNGAVRYFHNRLYPIDIHCVAQSIITLVVLRARFSNSLDLASDVFWWVRKHMWNADGSFAYRKLPGTTIRTPYMRWSEAWMLSALAYALQGASATMDQDPEFITACMNEMRSC